MVEDKSIFGDFSFQELSDDSELAEVTRSIGNDLLARYANKTPGIHDPKAALDFYKLLSEFYSSVRVLEKGKELSSPLQWPIDPYSFQPLFMWIWSEPERRAWDIIRSSALCFFPQWPELSGIQKEPYTHYFLDFANPWIKVAIEIDGSQHLSERAQKKDRRRDKRLVDLGYTVYRIPTTAIYNRDRTWMIHFSTYWMGLTGQVTIPFANTEEKFQTSIFAIRRFRELPQMSFNR